MRLDHLLSKEHLFSPVPAIVWDVMVGIGMPVPVVGCRWCVFFVANENVSWDVSCCGGCFGRCSPIRGVLGTLLGPEATGPLFAPGGGGGWCCRSILVVGCGVCFVDSGCEHLASKVSCSLCNFVFCVCKCLRAHGGCLGIESR